MPNYKLSSTPLSTGNASRGGSLNTSLLGAGSSVSVMQGLGGGVNPNVAAIRHTPTNVPVVNEDITSKSFQSFMAVTADAAFRYQDRESTYKANEARLAFSDQLNSLYNGTENDDGSFSQGYSSSSGALAIDGYSGFESRVNEAFDNIIEGLEPRVKQKAMVAMYGAKSTIMGKAANHKAGAMNDAIEAQKYELQKSAMLEVAADPMSIYTPDAITGMTAKDRFYSQFNDSKTADTAWYSFIQQTGETMYLNEVVATGNISKAVKKASAFYNEIGMHELAASPVHKSALQSNIQRWSGEAVRAENSSRDITIKLEDRARKERHRTGAQTLVVAQVSNEPISRADLAVMVLSDNIKASDAEAYIRRTYGEVDNRSTPEAITKWESILKGTAESDFKSGDMDLKYQFYKDPELSNTDVQYLALLQRDLQNPEYMNKYKRGSETIDTWMTDPFWDTGLHAQTKGVARNDASRELHARLSKGEDLDRVLADMQPRYDVIKFSFDKLPKIRGISYKPETIEGITNALEIVRTTFKDDPRQLAIEEAKLNRYIAWFKEATIKRLNEGKKP